MNVDPATYGSIRLGYDRLLGTPGNTIGDLASGALGDYVKTFHFVLNNYMAEDNRIPPYGFDCEIARQRNALPVPTDQYGGPALVPGDTCEGQTYRYWDVVPLNPPEGATRGDITLYYQGTSWEYVQFLWLANNEENEFLGQEGVHMLDAWINADPAAPMVPPFPMATATWGEAGCDVTEDPETSCEDGVDNDCDGQIDGADADCQLPETECDDYTTKEFCNDDPDCEWIGSPRNGSCHEAVACTPTEDPETTCDDGADNDCDGNTDCADADCGAEPVCQVDCSVYSTRNLCNAQAACSWDNKNKVCNSV
jgi:hypothetical protein